MPRHQPTTPLGGSLIRLPDGYLGIPSHSHGGSNPQMVRDQYANARRRRYARSWDGMELDAALVTRFTDPFTIELGCCQSTAGTFVAYHAGFGDEYGVIRDEAVHRHPVGNFPSTAFATQPNDAFESTSPTFIWDGNIGATATESWAIFICPACRRRFNPRNLGKLGKELFRARPNSHVVTPP